MRKLILSLCFSCLAILGYAQNVKISGVVTSAEDGDPMIGAYVKVKENASAGTVTNFDGQYSIEVKAGQTLLFSYLGCKTEERKVTASGTINVVLASDRELEEVVVVGYGTMKKSDLTGAVSTIAADKLQKTPAASVANALQGQAAGVTVNSNSGQPGAAPEVRIRGVGTINGASPIYVVDGVIVDDISFLSPNDIEHTEILKDASATAIYGSRGANGVVIITTKGGQLNTKTTISFDAYVGVQQRWRKLDVMNAQDYANALISINGTAREKKYYEENGFNKWLSLFKGVNNKYYPTIYHPQTGDLLYDYSANDTDWQDEVFRNAVIQNYHLSVDGGSEKTTYSLSGSWYSQEGTIIGSEYSRFTIRLNTSHKVNNWLKVGENVSFMSSKSTAIANNSESAGAGLLSAALAMAPWDPTHYPAGASYLNRKGETERDLSHEIAAASNFKNVVNPFTMVENTHPNRCDERLVGNLFVELTPIKHLTFRSSYSFDYAINRDRTYKDKYEHSTFDKMEKNFLSSSMSRTYNYTVDNILTYARNIGKHDFSVMAGQTVEEYNYYAISGSGSSILVPEERNWYLSQVTDDFGRPGDAVSRARRFSYLGRVHYAYDNRYMITVNFRADGSSKFPEKPWGYFPSTALAWRISEESFMKNFKNLDQLKLRVGWGKVGNDQIGNDAFNLKMFNTGPTFVDYVFGRNQALANGATVLTWVNQGGHWENTEQWSFGVDFGLWGNRLTGSVDYFIRNTNDMLMSVTAPAHVGNHYAGSKNVGKVRNNGIELTLEHRNQIRDFTYSIGGNVSYIKNKLTELNGGAPIYSGYNQLTVVDQGFPLYYFWGYKYEGIYRSDEEVFNHLPGYTELDTEYHKGDAKYADIDGDGKITDADRVNLGSSIPKVNYGLNIGLGWKNFDLQVFFQGVAGNKIYNQMRHRLEGNGNESILSPVMANAWTESNPDGYIPNPKNSVNYNVSDRFLENGSYFRLKNLQLGYTLPESLLKKSGIQNCRVYIQGSNLLTATKYTGYDPEVGGGIDYGNYPQSRSFIFGVNFSY